MNEFIKNQLVHDLLLEALKVDHIPDRCAWGTNWESIEVVEGYEKPPKEEFEAKLQELINAQPLKELRTKRNALLDQTDKYIVADYPHPTPEARQAWLDYRQALRDLPSTTEDPANPVWPVPPE